MYGPRISTPQPREEVRGLKCSRQKIMESYVWRATWKMRKIKKIDFSRVFSDRRFDLTYLDEIQWQVGGSSGPPLLPADFLLFLPSSFAPVVAIPWTIKMYNTSRRTISITSSFPSLALTAGMNLTIHLCTVALCLRPHRPPCPLPIPSSPTSLSTSTS